MIMYITSKRYFIYYSFPFLLCLILILSACTNNSINSENKKPDNSPTTTTTSTDKVAPVSETIVYTASNGKISFPRNPERNGYGHSAI
jgi:energy-converting hydrogenase Eha subunit F